MRSFRDVARNRERSLCRVHRLGTHDQPGPRLSHKAILVATGGFGRIFNKSTNALINTGDGQSLALRAGALLKDMEFVQFHPTTLYGTNILITERARGEGGALRNKDGERFMERYAPNSVDLAPCDVVARAIEQEIADGRGYDGGYVELDLRHLGADRILERLPGIRPIAIDFAGVDPIKDPVPVQPGQHYSMGGQMRMPTARPMFQALRRWRRFLHQHPRGQPARRKFPRRNGGIRTAGGR